MRISFWIAALGALCLWLVSASAHAQSSRAAVTASPSRTIRMDYAALPPTDPNFSKLWPTEAARDDLKPKVGPPPTVYVAYVREVSGSLLTITMIQAREECGPNECPFKILRDGKTIAEFGACNAIEAQRIAADGRTFLACGSRIPIP
jgi:hypothetical protein